MEESMDWTEPTNDTVLNYKSNKPALQVEDGGRGMDGDIASSCTKHLSPKVDDIQEDDKTWLHTLNEQRTRSYVTNISRTTDDPDATSVTVFSVLQCLERAQCISETHDTTQSLPEETTHNLKSAEETFSVLQCLEKAQGMAVTNETSKCLPEKAQHGLDSVDETFSVLRCLERAQCISEMVESPKYLPEMTPHGFDSVDETFSVLQCLENSLGGAETKETPKCLPEKAPHGLDSVSVLQCVERTQCISHTVEQQSYMSTPAQTPELIKETAEPLRPVTAELQRPATTELQRPATTEPQRPATTEPQRPSTTEPQRPATTEPQRPATTEPQRSVTAEETSGNMSLSLFSTNEQNGDLSSQRSDNQNNNSSSENISSDHVIREPTMEAESSSLRSQLVDSDSYQRTLDNNINNINMLDSPSVEEQDRRGDEKQNISTSDIRDNSGIDDRRSGPVVAVQNRSPGQEQHVEKQATAPETLERCTTMCPWCREAMKTPAECREHLFSSHWCGHYFCIDYEGDEYRCTLCNYRTESFKVFLEHQLVDGHCDPEDVRFLSIATMSLSEEAAVVLPGAVLDNCTNVKRDLHCQESTDNTNVKQDLYCQELLDSTKDRRDPRADTGDVGIMCLQSNSSNAKCLVGSQHSKSNNTPRGTDSRLTGAPTDITTYTKGCVTPLVTSSDEGSRLVPWSNNNTKDTTGTVEAGSDDMDDKRNIATLDSQQSADTNSRLSGITIQNYSSDQENSSALSVMCSWCREAMKTPAECRDHLFSSPLCGHYFCIDYEGDEYRCTLCNYRTESFKVFLEHQLVDDHCDPEDVRFLSFSAIWTPEDSLESTSVRRSHTNRSKDVAEIRTITKSINILQPDVKSQTPKSVDCEPRKYNLRERSSRPSGYNDIASDTDTDSTEDPEESESDKWESGEESSDSCNPSDDDNDNGDNDNNSWKRSENGVWRTLEKQKTVVESQQKATGHEQRNSLNQRVHGKIPDSKSSLRQPANEKIVHKEFNEVMRWNAFHVCPVCKKTLRSRYEFVKHLGNSVGSKRFFWDKEQKRFRCEPCSYTNTSLGEFIEHLLTKSRHGCLGVVSFSAKSNKAAGNITSTPAPTLFIPGYRCKMCGAVNRTRNSSKRHLERRHPTMKIANGGSSILTSGLSQWLKIRRNYVETFGRKPRLLSKLRMSKLQLNRNTLVYPCRVCKHKFSDKVQLQKHMRSHKEVNAQSVVVSAEHKGPNGTRIQDNGTRIQDNGTRIQDYQNDCSGKRTATTTVRSVANDERQEAKCNALEITRRTKFLVVEYKSGTERYEDMHTLMKYNACLVCPSCKTVSRHPVQFTEHFTMSSRCKAVFRSDSHNGTAFTCRPCNFHSVLFRELLHHLLENRKHGDLGYISFPLELLSMTTTGVSDSNHLVNEDTGVKGVAQCADEASDSVPGHHHTSRTTGGGEEDANRDSHGSLIEKAPTELLSGKMQHPPYFKPGYLCQICDVRVSGKAQSTAWSHLLRHTSIDGGSINIMYDCQVCNKPLDGQGSREPSHRCQGCGSKLWRRRPGKTEDLSQGRLQRAYGCQICNEHFVQRDKLNEHMKHHVESACTCGTCVSMVSDTARYKNMPIRKRKQLKSPAVCDTCGRTFHSISGLARHLELHKARPSNCPICHKDVDVLSYKKHLSSHRRYTCDQCGKVFKVIHHLTNHLLSHSNQRAWTCDLCGYAFNMKHHLESHMKTKHGGVSGKVAPGTPEKGSKNPLTNGKKNSRKRKNKCDNNEEKSASASKKRK